MRWPSASRGGKEIDFIATGFWGRCYIQVTETMAVPETRERELAPRMAIQDNYEKLVITMELAPDADISGIKIINAFDFLLSTEV